MASSGQVHTDKSLLAVVPELRALLVQMTPSRANPVNLELVLDKQAQRQLTATDVQLPAVQ